MIGRTLQGKGSVIRVMNFLRNMAAIIYTKNSFCKVKIRMMNSAFFCIVAFAVFSYCFALKEVPLCVLNS